MKKNLITLYFVVAFLTSLFYSSSPVGEVGLIIGIIPFAIFTFILVIKVLMKKEYINITKNQYLIISTLIITYIISSIVTRGFSFRELYAVGGIVVGICIIGTIGLKNNSREIIFLFLNSVIIVTIIAAVFGLVCYLTKTEIYIGDVRYGFTYDFFSSNGGIISIMSNVNSYALVCIVSVMFSVIVYFMTNNKIYKIILVVNIILQTIITFMTGSRTALMMLGVFILSYFVIFYKNKYKKYLYIAGVGSIITVLVLIFLDIIPKDLVIIQKMMNGDLTSGRAYIWGASLDIIKENLFFGVGIRNGLSAIGEVIGNPSNTLGTHNGYLAVLLANGILVFISVITLICTYIIKSFKRLKQLNNNDRIANSFMICFCLAMLCGNLTESVLFGDFNFPTVILWISLVMVSSYNTKNNIK